MYISHGVICRKFIPILKHILCDYDHADRNGQREFCDNFERVKNLKKKFRCARRAGNFSLKIFETFY